ncbi:GNAT family N-acetyltransferase [Rhodococcus opacus]|uniref:GNAT family N-acetyltransferase n=1 Tax=Rhodococcus opacus TaxID=37919 RepID=UPI0029C9D480|nr:GNAT family N-acetyltransferase [Rhodococcus opacus]
MPASVPDRPNPQMNAPLCGPPPAHRFGNPDRSESAGLLIRRLSPEDLPESARAHRELLPQGLFPALGDRFLRQWHACVLGESHGIALVVEDVSGPEHRIVGFLLGATDQSAHINGILMHRRALGKLIGFGVLALIRRPKIAIRFARTRAGPWTRRLLRSVPTPRAAAQEHVPANRTAVLSAVALYPEVRGTGTGTALVERFLVESRAAGAETATLVTKRTAEAAARFYERLGWHAVQEGATRDGAPLRIYRIPLDETVHHRKETGPRSGRQEGLGSGELPA